MRLRTALLLVAVASFISLPQTHAAFITHTSAGTFNPAVGSLNTVGAADFEGDSVGVKTPSFNSGGIGFVGSTLIIPAGPINLEVATGAGPGNALGAQGFGDFVGGAAPAVGDVLTINVPAGSRALGLNVLTNSPPDFTSLARLTIGSTSVDLFQGQPGTVLTNGFISYFLGISGPLGSDTFSSATLSFVGGGSAFRVDNVTVFSAIPEPSSLALVAVASIAGLARRRVRRA